MSKKSYHVIATIHGGWSVKRVGAERATKSFDTQKKAILYARKISISQDAELVIHNRDGRLLKKEVYGNDPKPVRAI